MPVFTSMGISQGSLIGKDEVIHVVVIGAHPDDCDIKAGGTAALFTELGHKVKFVSVTNGDAGHQNGGGGSLALRRYAETREAKKRLGINKYVVLNNHDGELVPSLEIRHQIMCEIREWNADLVITHRPNDYHPDHRYTGELVQDCAHLVIVPHLIPETPPLKKEPVFLYFQDHFQKPNAFTPDIAVAIDKIIEKKVDALDAHKSQFYEWIPWIAGLRDKISESKSKRKKWLKKQWGYPVSDEFRKCLEKWYGTNTAQRVKYTEVFEICEYGYQPDNKEIRRLFPMLGR